uniref:Uncharacterized protein n=1 Tax=Anguilla anguilla TaxID=7936 RepID=A0A0E9TD78_ANGAN
MLIILLGITENNVNAFTRFYFPILTVLKLCLTATEVIQTPLFSPVRIISVDSGVRSVDSV